MMHINARKPLTIFLVVVLHAYSIQAQEIRESAISLDSVFLDKHDIDLGDSLRIRCTSDTLFECSLVGSRLDTLYMRSEGRKLSLSIDEVDAIWVKKGLGTAVWKYTKRGALIGIPVGVVGFIVAAAMASKGADSDGGTGEFSFSDAIYIIAFGGGIGSAICGGLGFIYGITVPLPYWDLKYDASKK